MAFGKKKVDADSGVIETYTVVYRGGLPDAPKAKAGGIKLQLTADAFVFEPTPAAVKFFPPLTIPYEQAQSVEIVARQVSTVEGLLGGVNSRQLNQDNNIHFTYPDENGNQTVLRVEMLTGVTVMGQAVKCREFEDRLRTNHIRERFAGTAGAAAPAGDDVASQIKKLADLHAQGILTDDEFSAKKTQLLERL